MNESDIDLGGSAPADDDVFKDVPAGGFEPAKPGVAEGSLGGMNAGAEAPPEPEPEGDRTTDVAPEQETLAEPGTVGTFEPTDEERAEADEGPPDAELVPEPVADELAGEDRPVGAPGTPEPDEAPEPPEAPQEPESAPETPEEPPQEPAAPQEPAGEPGGRLDATRPSRRQGGTLSRDYMILERLDAGKLVQELAGPNLAPGIVDPIVKELTGVEVIVERTFENQGQQVERIRARNGQNALRAAGNMLPLGFEGNLAALSEKGLKFEPVKVGQREGRAVQVGGSS